MEEIYKEECPSCGGTTVENILRFTRREGMLCYVACATCGELVARYRIERYITRRAYESLLTIITRDSTDSTRRIQEQIEGISEEIREEYRRIKQIADQQEDAPPE